MNSIITAFARGIEKSGIDPCMISLPSDIPIAPEVIKNLGVDYFHVSRGRAIAFGTGLKLGNPALKIAALVGDLMTLGGNHFVHTGRRNMELLVICINNYVYEKIAGQCAPKTTITFSPYSTFEEPFNIPHLGNSCGALYTARWTALHTDELAESIAEGLKKRGLGVIEVIAPGPSYYSDISHIESELLNFYYKNSEIKNNEDPRNIGINPDGKIIVGKFTDKERPTFIDTYNAQLSSILGDKFTPHGVAPASKTSGDIQNG
jgi:2-oxoglutarate ferredoxin oxidoreductase subunit beta